MLLLSIGPGGSETKRAISINYLMRSSNTFGHLMQVNWNGRTMWTKLVWPPSSHLYHDCLMSRLCTNLVPKDNKIYNLLKTLKRNCVWQRSSLMRVTMLNRSYVPSSCPFSNISHSLNQRKLMKCTSTFSLAGYSWFNWGKKFVRRSN